MDVVIRPDPSIPQAAKEVGSTPRTLREWMKRGLFPQPYRTPGNDQRIIREELDSWNRQRPRGIGAVPEWLPKGTVAENVARVKRTGIRKRSVAVFAPAPAPAPAPPAGPLPRRAGRPRKPREEEIVA